jgi:hypothetical protein
LLALIELVLGELVLEELVRGKLADSAVSWSPKPG